MAGWSQHKGNFLKSDTKTSCGESYSLTIDNRKTLPSEAGQDDAHGLPIMSLKNNTTKNILSLVFQGQDTNQPAWGAWNSWEI